MASRPQSVFAWRKPTAHALVQAIIGSVFVAPLTFIVIFGLLPPFWGGQSRGILVEAAVAWQITWAATKHFFLTNIADSIPFVRFSIPTEDWIQGLRAKGQFTDFLVRSTGVVVATAWVAAFIFARACALAGRHQGFEHVSGPRVFEGWQALKSASKAISQESKNGADGIYVAPDFRLSLIRELMSFIVFGTQGSGKTTMLKFVLSQLIGKTNSKIVLLDQKGDLTAEWPAGDVIFFAPHDARSHGWDIGSDISTDIAAQEFAAALVQIQGSETVWPQGARQIVEAVIVALRVKHGRQWGFWELSEALQAPPLAIRDLVATVRPDVLRFLGVEKNGEFTRTSIGFVTSLQAASIPLLRPLALSWGRLPQDQQVSLHTWLHNNQPNAQTLILQNNTDSPTISAAWMRQVIDRLVQLTGSSSFPDDPDRRIWFVLDEFPQLGKISSLLKIPETHRSKGVTLFLTAQSISQAYAIYGEKDGDTLVNLLQTKVIFKTGQGSGLQSRINAWLGKVKWRDRRDVGVTSTGAVTPITEHESDAIATSDLNELGVQNTHVAGLIIGIGSDAYKIQWPFQSWPRQRPAVRPKNTGPI